jgi:hypothetical protein
LVHKPDVGATAIVMSSSQHAARHMFSPIAFVFAYGFENKEEKMSETN